MRPRARVSHYEVLTLIGRGGMGEVWRARDTKLDRDVAIKALPAELAADSDRLARLERIDGPTLADLLYRGPLGVERTLRIGLQVAAHQRSKWVAPRSCST